MAAECWFLYDRYKHYKILKLHDRYYMQNTLSDKYTRVISYKKSKHTQSLLTCSKGILL